MPNLGISGLASGFDWKSLVDQLADIERAPQRLLFTEQTKLQQRNNAYASIATQLGVLNNRVDKLKDATLFEGRATAVSDSTLASATASTGTALGRYAFVISQMATTSVQRGAANVGAALSTTNDVSSLTLSGAGFATAITAGTITVSGKTVTVAATDTLQGVFDKISAATSGAVTGSYDATTDKITLRGGSEVVLGSANDTSNFLLAAKLSNNASATVTSSASLGAIKTSAALASANLATAVAGGSAGAFKINGVAISFNTSTDSVDNVLARINDSTAGVTANYDSVNDRFQLTNKTTGDLGVALEDVTGNFLAATGLAGGALVRGRDLLYTINGGGQLASHSNTIAETTSGVAGLAVSVLDEGTLTVDVTSDSATIKTAITDFIAEFNRVQALIDTNTASTTDAKGKVTAGILAAESDAYGLASQLRTLANTPLSGLAGTVTQLAAMGIDSNGDDDTLELTDSAALDNALADNLSAVKDFFTNATRGLAVGLSAYLESVIGDDGSIVDKQDNLTRQASDIDTQISDQERLVQFRRDQLITSFLAMEQAQQRTNQQLQFLKQRFGT